MPVSLTHPLDSILSPVQNLLISLRPVIDFVSNLINFTIHHPILSVVIVLVTLFLVTGLVQNIMEWSKKFWDYIFIYSAKFVKLVLRYFWVLLVSIFRYVTHKNIPSSDKKN